MNNPIQQLFDSCQLPKVVLELAEHIGNGQALKLLLDLGNREVYIPTPEHLTEDHPLTVCLGAEDARKIASIYGGGTIRIPRGARKIAAERNLRIRQLAEQGHSIAWIAIKEELTERHIRNILYGP